jgi:hypothetical protein
LGVGFWRESEQVEDGWEVASGFCHSALEKD